MCLSAEFVQSTLCIRVDNVTRGYFVELYGLFVPQTIRTMGGLFVPWTIHMVDYSYVGLFIQWTFCTTDYSYYGLFVPCVKYSHNINVGAKEFLQAVYQMQADLGTRLIICMCICGMLVNFLVIMAKLNSSCCLLFHIF